MALITLGDLKSIWESIRDRAYDANDDMTKVKSVQKKFRDSFSGASLDTAKWDSSVGTGGSISVTGGTVVMASGTTINSETYILSKETFTVPFRLSAQITLSQRIANQSFYLEAVSVNATTGVPDGLHEAALLFDGTTATQAKYVVQNGGATELVSAASTFTTTAGTGVFEIEPFADECWFHSEVLDSTAGRANSYRRHQQIPDPNAVYKIRLRWLNGASAPASTTSATVQFVACQDYAELTAEITAGRGQAVAGQAVGVAVVSAPTTVVSGAAAHDAAVSGSPVRIAGRALTANYTGVATGDTADLVTTTVGALIGKPYAIPESDWQFACTSPVTNTTDLAVKASAGAGIRNYITNIQLINTNATATEFVIKDGATVIFRGYLGASMTSMLDIQFPTPLKGTAATAVNFAAITTSANIYVNAQGYIAP